MNAEAYPAVELIQLSKRFTDFVAVHDTNLRIEQGEFFSLLGPSGCGKTTTLRMIAGFEYPSSGTIRLMGQSIQHEPPHRRNVNMVFQNYALFPHLTVFDNVAFGLEVQRIPRKEIKARVEETIAMMRLSGLERRKPSQLSGGQQQRVALARALVNRPAVLLLDEPLGALDQKLRKDMQIELKRLQREVGITFIYVTHDQEEALTMSDRIAVMQGGYVLQVDAPTLIYERPTSRFVADFIGITNFLEGTFAEDTASLAVVDVKGLGQLRANRLEGLSRGQAVTLAVRPERIQLLEHDENGINDNEVNGTIEEIVFVGNDTHYYLRLVNGSQVIVREQNKSPRSGSAPKVGEEVKIGWAAMSMNILLS